MLARVAIKFTQKTTITKSNHLVTLIFFILAIIILFGIALSERVYSGGDYTFRTENALNWLDPHIGRRPGPHFLTEMSFLIVYLGLPRIDISTAAFITMLIYLVALGLVLYTLVFSIIGRAILSAVTALSLMLVTPVTILTWSIMNLNYGYIGITMYHNPTINVLKPLAVGLFIYATSAFSRPKTPHLLRLILVATLLTVISAVAKPNFIICFLPALGLLFAYKFLRRDSFNWQLLLFGIMIPGAIIVAAQYLITYEVDNNGIAIAPFYSMSLYPKSGNLILKFVMSLLFPLIVYALHFREARQHTALNLAWLTFFVGAMFTYLFAETGRRQDDGNFIWSGQITLFILFVQSTFFLLEQAIPLRGTFRNSPRTFICSAIFSLHVVSGILWWLVYAAESTIGLQPNIWR